MMAPIELGAYRTPKRVGLRTEGRTNITKCINLVYFSFVRLTPCIIRQLIGEKITNKCTGIVCFFLKCIYLFIATTCFGYSLAIIRVLAIR